MARFYDTKDKNRKDRLIAAAAHVFHGYKGSIQGVKPGMNTGEMGKTIRGDVNYYNYRNKKIMDELNK